MARWCECAVDAAPYLHLRLSSVAVSGKDDAPLTMIRSGMTDQEASDAYAQLRDMPPHQAAAAYVETLIE